MVVCYMRPFSGGDLGLPAEFVPTDPPQSERHESLKHHRDKIYAHTDKASGRQVEIRIASEEGDSVAVTGREQWLPFPKQLLPT
jgi:hypothetical protein